MMLPWYGIHLRHLEEDINLIAAFSVPPCFGLVKAFIPPCYTTTVTTTMIVISTSANIVPATTTSTGVFISSLS